ncbi:MAG: DUF5343 domain-containing protein [Acidobacteriota bacterium]
MADNPPYMSSATQLEKVLGKIKEAKTPPRFTNDFLYSKLSIKTKSARPAIGVAKRIGLLNADGTPTDLYKAFRSTNTKTSGAAMATAIRRGYSELYSRNEYAHSLKKEDLRGLVIEVTGLEAESEVVRAIVGTFDTLRKYADFDAELDSYAEVQDADSGDHQLDLAPKHEDLNLGLSYTINLVLPKTDDVAVFNAIFKSLRENLLRK